MGSEIKNHQNKQKNQNLCIRKKRDNKNELIKYNYTTNTIYVEPEEINFDTLVSTFQ